MAALFLALPLGAQEVHLVDFYRVDVGGSALNIRAMPSTGAQVLARLTTGTVLRNLGCRFVEGRDWCAIEQPIRGGVRGWAAADFLHETAPPTTPTWVGDRVLAGADLGATGRVACAIGPDAPTMTCEHGVVRGGSGNAVLVIQLPDGSQRTIEFKEGAPISSDAGLIASRKSNGVTQVAVGAAERYEIPDSVIGSNTEWDD